MSRNIFFSFFLLSFLSGVFVNNYFLNYRLSLLILLSFAVLFFIYYLVYKKFIVLLLVIIIGGVGGIVLSYLHNKKIEENNSLIVQFFDARKHNIIFELADIYKIKDYSVDYLGRLKSMDSSDFFSNDINFLISIPINIDVKKGQVLSINSKLYKIENFSDFDYKNYMLSKSLYFKVLAYSSTLLDSEHINKLESIIDDARQKLLDIVDRIYPKNEALFLGGILFGARESLSEEIKTKFNNSGLAHIIAVSGFNITILIAFFTFLFKYIPIIFRIIFISLIILSFVLFVGDTAPVVRASIMGLISYYALAFGRTGDAWTILLFSAFIMVLFSPLMLNYDVSFHLSFLAVIGIIFTSKFFDRIFSFLPKVFAIREAFVLTISAMLFTLPIMMFNFGQISIIAPIANIAVAWTIPFAMLFGFISVLAYLFYPLAGVIIGYIDWVFLKYDMLVVNLFGSIDSFVLRLDFGAYKEYFQLLYFLIVGFLVLYFKGTQEEKNERKAV